jgi:hypothetical protein
MKRLATALALIAAALMVTAATQAAPPQAKWVRYPTCTATAISLTCTGKATGIRDPYALRSVIWTLVYYTCPDDGYVAGSIEATTDVMRNGKSFTITFVPSGSPSGPLTDPHQCLSAWTREDPNFYDVQVGAGIPAGGAEYPEISANLGTISP